MRKRVSVVVSLLALAASSFLVALTAGSTAAATLTRVTGFGADPSNLDMYTYVPSRQVARPALLVAVHNCAGSAQAFFSGAARDYVEAADTYGFVIVFPEATREGHCFDVSTPQALERDGGGDSTGIISMVRHAQKTYRTDPARTFLMGASSGAMMTNVLAAQYPDVFAAATVFGGVPASCFETGTSNGLWNSDCAGGRVIKTPQQWADAAHAMYPGYTGSYPRMQLWHGSTDDVLGYPNFGEEVKQWTALHGLTQTPTSSDHPQSSWTRNRYGARGAQAHVEAVSIAGVGHTLPQPGMAQQSIAFLGLDGAGSPAASTALAASTQLPCDIYAAGKAPCVAADATTR
jgi:poly(hydroxyalkanoate) depolymerase family esterase